MNKSEKTGVIYAIFAYSAWGLFPVYWKFLTQVPAVELVSHRIIWSAIFLLGLLWIQQQQREFWQVWKSPKLIASLLLTTVMIACNWGVYIYGVNTSRIVETSLGYYINPLVSVLLGAAILKERLNQGQKLAVLIAAIAVSNFVWHFGQVPWIALFLAFSFAMYGLLRKLITVSPIVGLTIETLLALPIAFAWVGHGFVAETGFFGTTLNVTLLLMGCGIVTALPLLWFNNAAKRLRLSTMGFFQYLAPSIQLALGVLFYREPFTAIHAATFTLIWAAIALYSASSMRKFAQNVS
ncbi:MAG: EamA family transporter RarD [Leptolyngbya sp. Prado105]|nr:EamA family transporter RarD [Leptolyngbya sp. Prado105]